MVDSETKPRKEKEVRAAYSAWQEAKGALVVVEMAKGSADEVAVVRTREAGEAFKTKIGVDEAAFEAGIAAMEADTAVVDANQDLLFARMAVRRAEELYVLVSKA